MEEEKKGFVVKDKRGIAPESSQGQDAPEALPEEGKTAEDEHVDKIAETAQEANPASDVSKEEESEKQKKKHESEPEEAALPTVNFVNFIISLGTSALFHLGMFPDPESNQIRQNIPAAKQTIDVIAMLQEKTKGNLASEEVAILEESLYSLRMSYIKALQSSKAASEQKSAQEK